MDRQALERQQPAFFRIITNQLTNQKLAHAYLFSGDAMTKDGAFYLAASLVCTESKTGACGVCSHCLQVEANQYNDLIYIDGTEESIKKDDIQRIQDQFALSALDVQGKKIYILDGVEYATAEAMNSLLKFLEEPASQDVLALLLTQNIDQVMATIVSRCQVIRFNPANEAMLEALALSYGIEAEEAHFVSRTVSSPRELEAYSSNTQAQKCYQVFSEYMVELFTDVNLGTIYLQRQVVKGGTLDRPGFRKFLQFVCQYLSEAIDHGTSSLLCISQATLDKNKQNLLHYLQVYLTMIDKITRSANLGLLSDELGYELWRNPDDES